MKDLYQLGATDTFLYDRKIGSGAYGTCHAGIMGNGKQTTAIVLKEMDDLNSYKREKKFGKRLTERYVEHMAQDHSGKHCKHPSHFITKFLGTLPSHAINYVNARPKTKTSSITPKTPVFKFHSAITLSKLLEKIKAGKAQILTLEQIKILSFQMLQQLSLLEEEKILHLDLKPANLMVKGLDNLEKLKIILIDFGLSESSFHTPSELKQTCRYRHPLADLFGKLTHSADLWSLGCILYELIIGEVLFNYYDYGDRNQFIAVTKAINEGEFPQEWLKNDHAFRHSRVKYDKSSNTFFTTPTLDATILGEDLEHFKHTYGIPPKDYLILNPIRQAAYLKGYDHNESEELADLIARLVSYNPPTIKEALGIISSILKSPSPTDVIELTPYETIMASINSEEVELPDIDDTLSFLDALTQKKLSERDCF